MSITSVTQMGSETIEKQLVSKKRVADHGEVYTNQREVKAMLDLVKTETERIESRFLEPACGTGNFLIEILARKLHVAASRYRKSQIEYERNIVLAVGSIYGIDILEDNVLACRKRLFEIVDQKYSTLFKKTAKEACRATVKFILKQNIIWGDALTLMTVDKNPQPIVFSEWSTPFNNSMLKRRDYTFSDLLPNDRLNQGQPDLFSKTELVSDLGEKVFMPKEKQDFSPVHFLKIGKDHE